MTRQEFIEKHPELSDKKFWTPISSGMGEIYYEGKRVYILDPLSGLYQHLNISSQAIKDISNDLTKFAAILDYFRTDTKEPFEFIYEKEDSKLDFYSLSKYEIIKGLEALILHGDIRNDPQARTAYNTLLPLVSLDALKNKYQDSTYEIKLDGIDYSIPTKDIISLLTAPNSEYSKTISQEKINGIKTEHFLCAATQLAFSDAICECYYFSDDMVKRFQKLNEYKDVDFEAVNKFVTTNNPFLDGITIHPDLRDEVLGEMPEDYSDIEKAIYIYLKMCETLTYDPEFYAVDQKGPLAEKHKQIENTGLITPENNKIVCYEFSALYSKFLSEQNINHRLYRTFSDENEHIYGKGHFKTDFRCGKFLISADSVTGILDSDLTSAKTDWNIHGIDAVNQSKETREEFRSILSKIILDIKEQEYGIRQEQEETPYEEVIDEYAAVRPVLEGLDFNGRMTIMFEQLGRQGLEGIDAHSYLLQLRKSLFTPEELENNIDITILRHNTGDPENPVDIVSIVTTSENYRNSNSPMEYILYSTGMEPRHLEKDDMEELMSSETLSYYTYPMKRVPGIFPQDSDETCARFLGLLDD